MTIPAPKERKIKPLQAPLLNERPKGNISVPRPIRATTYYVRSQFIV